MKTELIDPDGKSVMAVEGKLNNPASDEFSQDIFKVVGIVLKPGPYILRTTVLSEPQQQYEENFRVVVA